LKIYSLPHQRLVSTIHSSTLNCRPVSFNVNPDFSKIIVGCDDGLVRKLSMDKINTNIATFYNFGKKPLEVSKENYPKKPVSSSSLGQNIAELNPFFKGQDRKVCILCEKFM
jgi:hypothetical protein